MFDEQAFWASYHGEGGKNLQEAMDLKWWILKRLKAGETTADEIYKDSECGDQAMYLALHDLIKNKLIVGPDPFENGGSNHNQWKYELAVNNSAEFFSDVAEYMAAKWDPNKWGVNTVSS